MVFRDASVLGNHLPVDGL